LAPFTPRQARDDLRRAYALIGEATGRMPRRYRPPYGIFNAAALALARSQRWQPLLWSKDGRDWQQHATADSIVARVTRDLRGSDVILLHDADHYSAPGSWRQTIAALPRILEAIDRQRVRTR
jgi:peptidoglycan/xylan/chitin deacetylase (PgdA/CDA1 family)